MRQIVLDTETTGIAHEDGHRIIEIGCIEMVDRQVTQNHFHVYINPMRAVDEGAFKVHGISDAFLSDKPTFSEIVTSFIAFIDGAELIIHNAAFDVGFLNAEFRLCKLGQSLEDMCQITDTLMLARQKHPGQRNSLDALCKRYDIDNSHRELHGALLDAEILAYVYLAMTGGQTQLFAEPQLNVASGQDPITSFKTLQSSSPILRALEDEMTHHREFLDVLEKKSGKHYWSS